MPMPAEVKGALVGAIATIIVAAIGGYVSWEKLSEANDIQRKALEKKIRFEKFRADAFEASINLASSKFTRNIDRLLVQVRKELDRKEGPSRLVQAARALVSGRDSFRKGLAEIQVNLDGDFDAIANELPRIGQPDPQRLKQLLETFERSWPAKKSALEVAIRRALAKLGLKPTS